MQVHQPQGTHASDLAALITSRARASPQPPSVPLPPPPPPARSLSRPSIVEPQPAASEGSQYVGLGFGNIGPKDGAAFRGWDKKDIGESTRTSYVRPVLSPANSLDRSPATSVYSSSTTPTTSTFAQGSPAPLTPTVSNSDRDSVTYSPSTEDTSDFESRMSVLGPKVRHVALAPWEESGGDGPFDDEIDFSLSKPYKNNSDGASMFSARSRSKSVGMLGKDQVMKGLDFVGGLGKKGKNNKSSNLNVSSTSTSLHYDESEAAESWAALGKKSKTTLNVGIGHPSSSPSYTECESFSSSFGGVNRSTTDPPATVAARASIFSTDSIYSTFDRTAASTPVPPLPALNERDRTVNQLSPEPVFPQQQQTVKFGMPSSRENSSSTILAYLDASSDRGRSSIVSAGEPEQNKDTLMTSTPSIPTRSPSRPIPSLPSSAEVSTVPSPKRSPPPATNGQFDDLPSSESTAEFALPPAPTFAQLPQSHVPVSGVSMVGPAAGQGGFPGSAVFTLISLEQAQEREKEKGRREESKMQMTREANLEALMAAKAARGLAVAGANVSGTASVKPSPSDFSISSNGSNNDLKAKAYNVPEPLFTPSPTPSPDAPVRVLKTKKSTGLMKMFNKGDKSVHIPAPPPVPHFSSSTAGPKISIGSNFGEDSLEKELVYTHFNKGQQSSGIDNKENRPAISKQTSFSSLSENFHLAHTSSNNSINTNYMVNSNTSGSLAVPTAEAVGSFPNLRLRPVSIFSSSVPQSYLSTTQIPEVPSLPTKPSADALSPIAPSFSSSVLARSQLSDPSTNSFAPSPTSPSASSFYSSGLPSPNLYYSSFEGGAGSGYMRKQEQVDPQVVIAAVQAELANFKKRTRLQYFEYEAQIRELKDSLSETQKENEMLKTSSMKLAASACENCTSKVVANGGVVIKPVGGGKVVTTPAVKILQVGEKEKEDLISPLEECQDGSVLNRARVKTGGARGVFGSGSLKEWEY